MKRLEAGLDRLAAVMVGYGEDGRKFIPSYERLERELEEMRSQSAAADAAWEAVRERVRRSKDRKATSP
jgi:hypothetical protein